MASTQSISASKPARSEYIAFRWVDKEADTVLEYNLKVQKWLCMFEKNIYILQYIHTYTNFDGCGLQILEGQRGFDKITRVQNWFKNVTRALALEKKKVWKR